MLYISRITDSKYYGVVDTDDNVETVVHGDILKAIVLSQHIPIEGVQVNHHPSMPRIIGVVPYQDPATYTQLQVKTKTLKGVEVRTYKDEITAIICNSNTTKRVTYIRLSDFASYIGKEFVLNWKPMFTTKKLVLVLDDKIKCRGMPPRINLFRACWDIREMVSSPEFVDEMYKTLIYDELVSTVDWNIFLIDNEERIKKWVEIANSMD